MTDNTNVVALCFQILPGKQSLKPLHCRLKVQIASGDEYLLLCAFLVRHFECILILTKLIQFPEIWLKLSPKYVTKSHKN